MVCQLLIPVAHESYITAIVINVNVEAGSRDDT